MLRGRENTQTRSKLEHRLGLEAEHHQSTRSPGSARNTPKAKAKHTTGTRSATRAPQPSGLHVSRRKCTRRHNNNGQPKIYFTRTTQKLPATMTGVSRLVCGGPQSMPVQPIRVHTGAHSRGFCLFMPKRGATTSRGKTASTAIITTALSPQPGRIPRCTRAACAAGQLGCQMTVSPLT